MTTTNVQRILLIHRKGNIPDPVLADFKTMIPAGYNLDITLGDAPDGERKAKVGEADYIVAYGVAFEDLDAAKNVRLMQLLSAGFDRLNLDDFRAAGIPVCNNGGANGPTVAEHAVMLMLAVYKKVPLHHNSLHDGKWLGHAEALSMRELRGKQVGIVGFGHIGRDVAHIVRGFRANPVYYDVARAPAEVEAENGASYMDLDELLSTSDIVTVHTPLNDATRGLMNAEAFARMKPSAIFVNTARGKTMDEGALIAALNAKKLAGAGLDVFENEPMEPGNALLGRDNVVVSPHIAGTTIDTWTRRLEFAIANVQRVANGEEPEAKCYQ